MEYVGVCSMDHVIKAMAIICLITYNEYVNKKERNMEYVGVSPMDHVIKAMAIICLITYNE